MNLSCMDSGLFWKCIKHNAEKKKQFLFRLLLFNNTICSLGLHDVLVLKKK